MPLKYYFKENNKIDIDVNIKDNDRKREKSKEYMVNKKIKCLIVFLIIIINVNFINNNIIYGAQSVKSEKLIGNLALTTFIYDKDGNKVEELHGTQNRILVDYEDLPTHVVDAIVSIEDERYWYHNGIDIKRTLGAIITYLVNSGSADFGGSTITQQLVKNITEDKEGSIARKVREWIRALKLEIAMSKEEILESYVNTIYFGEGSYGIEVACKNYFSKSVKDLNVAESAVIAAAIQSPESTNPYKSDASKKRLLDRQRIVLNKMLELGHITSEEYEIAKNTDLEFKKSKELAKVQSYFIDAVIEDLIVDIMAKEEVNYNTAKRMVYTNGYKIYTTLDPSIQNTIDSCYTNSNLFYPDPDGKMMQSAMVVMDQKTGNVLGIKGGVGEKTSDLSFNRATQSYRQPGSCMKPLGAYGPAFEKNALTPNSVIQDAPITIKDWSPQNYYNYFYGNVTVKEALAKSMNTPAVRANQMVDINFAFNFAKNAGLKSLVLSDMDISPLALGGLTHGVTPLEMASAYATIANNGVYNTPKFYTKVLDKNNNEYIVKSEEGKQVMRASTAYMLTTCLKGVVEPGGTAYGYVKVNNVPVAGKTGNTNDDYDQWFCGYTPYYTIACWNGYDKNKSINRPYPYYAVRMFNMVANEISNGQIYQDFSRPVELVETEVCKLSRLLPNDACRQDYRGSHVITDYVDLQAIGNRTCDAHEMVRICSISNQRANSSCKYTYLRPCVTRVTTDNDKYYLAPEAFCKGHTDSISNTIINYFYD